MKPPSNTRVSVVLDNRRIILSGYMNYTKNLVDKLVDKFVYQRMLICQGFYVPVDKFVYQKPVDQYLITSRPPLPPKR